MDYICAICGVSISKRKSVSIGDGKRACRTHQEALDKSQSILEAEKVEKVEKQKPKKRAFSPEQISIKPTCWICRKEGMRQDEYFMRMLVENQKHEIKTGLPINPFNPTEVRQAAGALAGELCLFFVEWVGKNKKIRLPYRTYESVRLAEDMFGLGVMLICPTCCKEKGFETLTDQRLDSMGFEGLMNQSIIYEGFVKPEIEKIALEEMGL